MNKADLIIDVFGMNETSETKPIHKQIKKRYRELVSEGFGFMEAQDTSRREWLVEFLDEVQ